MARLIAATAITLALGSTVLAQGPSQMSSPPPPGGVDQPRPLPGANSFTEGQAKDRLEKHGYTNVGTLQKDRNGVWRGRAIHSGKEVAVSVDFRGTITQN